MTNDQQNSGSLETTNISMPSDFQKPTKGEGLEDTSSSPRDIILESKVVSVDISSELTTIPIQIDLKGLADLEYVREMNDRISKLS